MSAEFLGLTVGLGLAGFDALPFFAALSLLVLNVPRRNVLVYSLTVLVVPVLLGMVLSRVLGAWLSGINLRGWLRDGDWLSLTLELLLAAALVWVAIRRLRGDPPLLPSIDMPSNLNLRTQVGLGLFALAGITLDLPYVSFQVAASRQPWLDALWGQLVWVGVSQVLVVLTLPLLWFASVERIAQLRQFWQRTERPRHRWLSFGMLVVAALLVADALSQMVLGNYLLSI